MRFWLGLAALVVAPMAANAAPTAVTDFAAVLQNSGHRSAIAAAAEQSAAWTHIACPDASFHEAPEIGVYVPVQFNPGGEPVAGEWREGIVASGCGAPIILNVLTKVTATATLASGPLLPGTTIADPVLQNASQAYAVAAAGGIPAGCKDAYISNTAFAGYEGPADKTLPAGEQAQPWKEVWTLSLCGSVKDATLHFTPTTQGVTIRADPKETGPG